MNTRPPLPPKVSVEINELLVKFSVLSISEPSDKLIDWIDASGTIDTNKEYLLSEIVNLLAKNNVNDWFEEDLKMKAISLIMFLADLDEGTKIGVFYKRALHWKTPEFSLSVVSNCMVASVKGRGGAGSVVAAGAASGATKYDGSRATRARSA